MSRLFAIMLLVSTFLQSIEAMYNLAEDYSGDTFFQGFDFFTQADPTKGHVLYQSQVDARAKGLISIQQNRTLNTTKQIFIGVDSSNLTPQGRPSVRITSQKTFQHALVLADIAHQPGGICGVWPALWMVGAQWPDMGEIDIVEGVSTQAANQMTLHTNAGPILDHKAEFSGKLLTPNCDVNAPNQSKNAGCGIADDSNITFGNDFNAIGGGVYAMEWTSNFIKIWFFPRNRIPADIQKGDPTAGDAWGTPNSLFQGKFNMDDHFKNLSIVMNTAFCGEWAGQVWSDTPECAALAPTCDEYVTNNPKAFDQAFWLVNSIKIFQEDGKASNSTATTPTATSLAQPARTTVTETITVQPTAAATTATTSPPRPTGPRRPFNATGNPNGDRPHPHRHGDGEMKPPNMMFGSPGFNKDSRKKRRGGAVLPSRLWHKMRLD